ncbi:MAG: hypothetical protein QNJ23_12115 [Woeseiaceae bacterium]|nr:hypothetical protein [Woeseiaceae bacterium]
MDFILALYLLLVASLLLFLALIKPPPVMVSGVPERRWERRCSWLLVVTFLGVNILRLQSRAMDALATQGLSTQNKIQVIVVAAAALWCGYLLASGRIRIARLVSGPGFWLLALTGVFALSVAWSTWPTLTVFRVTELAVFWIVACHVFGGDGWSRKFESLMWVAWWMYATWAILLITGFVEGVSTGGLVGIATSNSASLLTGLLLLWTVHRFLTESSLRHAWKLPMLVLSLIVFGSLATFVFVLFCTAIMMTLHTRGQLRFVMISCAICLAAAGANILVVQTGEPGAALVDTTSALSGKSRDNITGMTGRLELWTNIWESTRSQPWGFGFAAFERTLGLNNASLSWKAGNAHNGFISAWLGAGWLAVTLLLAFLVSVWARRRTIDAEQRPVFVALLALLILNNLTVPAIGGRLTVAFLVLMALTHIPAVRQLGARQVDLYERG